MNQHNLSELTERLITFRDERDWKQFHSLKNLMISLNLEASEMLELTQWKEDAHIEKSIKDENFKTRLGEECADVFIYLLLIAERAGFDLLQATAAKIKHNENKYPVDKARGNAKKYTEFEK